MVQYVIQQKASSMYIGELSPNGKNSEITASVFKAKKFHTAKDAKAHIEYCIATDAGITSARNVMVCKLYIS